MNTHAVLSTASERMHIRVFLQRGSACFTIWPRFSLLPHCLCLSRFSHSRSCRAGNLLNSHTHGKLWCCPKRTHRYTHRNTSGACCTDHTAQRVLSSLFSKWKCQGFLLLSPFFFIEVVSIAIQSRISEDVRCKSGKKRKLYTVMLVVCVSRRVFGVPAWNHNLLSRVTMRKETVQ